MGRNHLRFLSLFFFFLVDGFKHFLFSIIYGIILSYFSRWLKHVKTTNQLFFRACDLIIAFCPGFSGWSLIFPRFACCLGSLGSIPGELPHGLQQQAQRQDLFWCPEAGSGQRGWRIEKWATEKTWGPCYGKCWGVFLGCYIIYIYI